MRRNSDLRGTGERIDPCGCRRRYPYRIGRGKDRRAETSGVDNVVIITVISGSNRSLRHDSRSSLFLGVVIVVVLVTVVVMVQNLMLMPVCPHV